MNKEREIKESLEFCKDIYVYYETDHQEKKIQDHKERIRKYTEAVNEQAASNVAGFEEQDMVESKAEYRSFMKEIIRVVLCLVLAFATTTFLSTYVVQVTSVQGDSMEATVSEGDKLLVNKLLYHGRNPERFDVIVFSRDDGTKLIKRIIGLPGEKVEIKKGKILVDDVILKEHYGLEEMNPKEKPMMMQLGNDEYFVLGDNRGVSLDSRYSSVGAVKFEDIIGKVSVRIYPFSQMCVIE